MSQSITESSIMSFVAPTRRRSRRGVRAELRRLRRDWRRQSRKYGHTEAERASKELLRAEAKRQARAIAIGRRGRRIDLLALLAQRRPDGKRRWALVDPLQPIGGENGRVRERQGLYMIKALGAWQWRYASRRLGREALSWTSIAIGVEDADRPDSTPAAIPPLPRQARRIVEDQAVRRRATWVGLLYQPEEWMEARPDPAIVVEWQDLPGEYFALAVWGVDGPRIMEFVS